jgi:hypothetical protein
LCLHGLSSSHMSRPTCVRGDCSDECQVRHRRAPTSGHVMPDRKTCQAELNADLNVDLSDADLTTTMMGSSPGVTLGRVRSLRTTLPIGTAFFVDL